MLRRFARDYPTEVKKSARAIALEIKVSPTAYNNFAHKRIGKTQDRVRRPIAELYLRVRREKREAKAREEPQPLHRQVAERSAEYLPGEAEARVRDALPTDRDQAVRLLRKLLSEYTGDQPPGDTPPESQAKD